MSKTVIAVFTLMTLLIGAMFGGTTGKIAGRITDGETGEGLPGVNIVIEGTTLGASTDLDGAFIVLNVPPGLHTLTISFIGYQTVKVKEVRVNVDFTTRIEQKISPSTVELGEVEVFGEKNPLVRQDLVNTQVAVTSETIESLPVDQISEVISLQAGITQDNNGALHIRGGRSNEIAYQVNGLSINNPFGNSQGVGVAVNAIEEVSISAGTFSAEYGNALSGVINYVTKDGGSKLAGSMRAFTGDHVSDRTDIFPNIDEADAFNNSRAEWTLGGPVPLLGNKLTFFTSGVWQRDNGHLYGQRIYETTDLLFIDGDRLLINPFGLFFDTDASGNPVLNASEDRRGANGDGSYVPMVTREALNITGKLTWQPAHNIKLTYDLIFDDGERFSSSSSVFRRYRFTPNGRPKTVSTNYSHSLGLTHSLSKKLFYTLKVGYNDNQARTSVFEDPLDPRYVPTPGNDITNVIIPPTDTYVAGGTDLNHNTEVAKSYLGRLDFVWQALPNHEFKFGGEAASHELTLDQFQLHYDFNNGNFVIPSEDINPAFTDFQRYTRRPVQGALYFLDKIELSKRFILNAGIRYEYFHTQAPYNPDLAGTVDAPGGVGNQAYWLESEAKHRIMPRLGLSFPITTRGIIRFSYGIFHQNPTFRSIYRNPRFEDFDFIRTPSFGNPNLNPERSIQYELGLQQQFTQDVKVDLTVFYKDVNDLIQSRRVIAGEVAVDKEYNVITNISYANVKGFTVAFLKRRSPGGLFSATLDYTFQIGEGAFTDPLRLAVDTRTGRETEQKFVPLGFDRKHTLNGTATLAKPGDWLASVIMRIQQGTPYTPSLPSSIQAVQFEVNSERRPWRTTFDLQIEKFFKFNPARFSIFLQVKNLFDSNNETFVHTNTGRSLTNLNEATNPNRFNNLEEKIIADQSNFFPVEFLDTFYQREDFLAEPREVRLGMTFSF